MAERHIGKGYALSFQGRRNAYLQYIDEVLINTGNAFPWKGIPSVLKGRKHVYASRLEDRILYYDPKRHTIFDERYPA